MTLTFNIKVYHSTDIENIRSIVDNGFYKDSVSCATSKKEHAIGYGDSVISFKYPYKIRFRDIFWFLINKKNLFVKVSGYKPNKIKIENNQ